ncbi:threonine aldolase family protein [Bacteroidota bacterium]
MLNVIDLRSDTVTKPSKEMLQAMVDAEVGDDVYKEDPTVNKLENYTAELLGKEATLFVPSGLMGNQICLNVWTNPSDEVICDMGAHIFQYESGSPAALSGLQVTPIMGDKGRIKADQIEPMIRPASAYYMPRTKVIELENTHNRAGGIIQPIENIKEISKLAKDRGLIFHMDGARLWNASVATGISLAEYSSYFDSLSVCLSKGLGAPIGSVIAGPKDFITEAYRIRKAWGGGMRQVGVIAAAGLYALKNNIERLKEDHEKAELLAENISKIDNLEIDKDSVETNIMMFTPKNMSVDEGIKKCEEKGLRFGPDGFGHIRAVTHMDVSFEEIETANEIMKDVFG